MNASAQQAQPEQLLNSLESSAERLGIKRTTLWRLVRAKKLKVVKLGSRTMIAEVELTRFVASLEAPEL
jgi:excisionase family DNA binding protein